MGRNSNLLVPPLISAASLFAALGAASFATAGQAGSSERSPKVVDASAGMTRPIDGPRSTRATRGGAGMMGLAIPYGITLGVESEISGAGSVGVRGGFLRRSVAGAITLESRNLELRMGYTFGKSGFYGGLGAGRQWLKAKWDGGLAAEVDGAAISVPSGMRLSAVVGYVTPYLGWSFPMTKDWSIGSEVGYQQDVSSKATYDATLRDAPRSTWRAIEGSSGFEGKKKALESQMRGAGQLSVLYVSILAAHVTF